jgi:Fic family protein
MASKKWNWQFEEWPNFKYDDEALKAMEYRFSQISGTVLGALKHIEEDEKDALLVEILSNEAFNTSAIEGEYLDRESIQSSIKKNLGLTTDKKRIPLAEQGISEMTVDLYRHFEKPLTHEILFEWHEMLTYGRRDLTDIGRYRTHDDPMQVVSGRIDKPHVHFEAPPSKKMQQEMDKFVQWFNKAHEKKKILPVALAGMAHIYFVGIHPFEDGNGRIGRAISEKSLAMSLGQPALTSLSQTIENSKKAYYGNLESHNTTLDITKWLVYFGKTIIEAQENTLKTIEFSIEKAKFFDRFNNVMNDRQTKVVKRLFDAGHEGFKGGLSAENYIRIAKTSASTATRDLKDMVEKVILVKTGTLKSTRYWLNLQQNT